MKIEKPGPYKLRNGLKATVLTIHNGYAIGFITSVGDTPGNWVCIDGHFWTSELGTGCSKPGFKIVSEWIKPIQKTVRLYLLLDGRVVMPPNHFLQECIAVKEVTITQGEGK